MNHIWLKFEQILLVFRVIFGFFIIFTGKVFDAFKVARFGGQIRNRRA
jgi:hypothetical protein